MATPAKVFKAIADMKKQQEKLAADQEKQQKKLAADQEKQQKKLATDQEKQQKKLTGLIAKMEGEAKKISAPPAPKVKKETNETPKAAKKAKETDPHTATVGQTSFFENSQGGFDLHVATEKGGKIVWVRVELEKAARVKGVCAKEKKGDVLKGVDKKGKICKGKSCEGKANHLRVSASKYFHETCRGNRALASKPTYVTLGNPPKLVKARIEIKKSSTGWNPIWVPTDK